MKFSLARIAVAGICLGMVPALAQMHQAHEHGRATINIALEEGAVVIELVTPAESLLGFEHRPETDDERDALMRVTGLLGDYRSVLRLNATDQEPDCRQDSVEIDSALLETHEHEGEQSHGDDDHGHADFHVRYQLQCADTPLLGLDIELLRQFPGVAEVALQWLDEAGQGGATVRPEGTVVRLSDR